ncbi:MAG: hypothetical protein LQ351_007176 [Letrouitia transgressa]|nr:MAG: hypothetical protein LQ351_007176 [Letrouitia transgressa]
MSSALLSFGVEIEHILLFHSSLLHPHLPSSTLIVRDLSSEKRLALRDTSHQYNATRPYYNGWALTSTSNYPFDNENRQRCLQTHGCRGYADEVLKLERQVFLDKAASIDVDVDAGPEDETGAVVKPRSFERWHLTRDNSLTGLDAQELRHVLEHHGIVRNKNEQDERDWDSSALELVSRVLPFSDRGFRELEDALAVLNNNNNNSSSSSSNNSSNNNNNDDDDKQSTKYIATTNQFCGLHVHIGLPPPDASYLSPASGDTAATTPPPTFALKTLQHLALLLAVFEPHINALHAPHRAPGGVDLLSNRESFLQEPEYVDEDEDDSGYASDNGASGTDADTDAFSNLDKLHASLEEDEVKEEQKLRKRARDAIFAAGMTAEGLSDLMSPTRSRVVNFTYLKRADGRARTVEFRQMEGCLDARAIRNWVGFCGGMVRLAEKLGESGEDWVDDEGKVWEKETVGWRDLIWEMGTSEEVMEWWEGRWKRMEKEREQCGDLSR